MPCYHPLTGYRSPDVGKSGKRGITFSRNASLTGVGFKLPCGQCIGCRLEQSRQWAMRCVHEAQMHKYNEFLTLTYDDESLPSNGSLIKRHLQLFFKRLRKKYGKGVRFYACGEYGETLGRPHYHAIVFNLCITDKRFYKRAKSGELLWTSPTIDKIWGLGYVVIGSVTFDSAAYVARYITKKVTGDRSEAHYCGRLPEFTNMSRRPGIGYRWFEKFGMHSYNFDKVVMRGVEVRPPRYYDGKYELTNSEDLVLLKAERKRRALLHKEDQTPDRRRVCERVTYAKMSNQRREL